MNKHHFSLVFPILSQHQISVATSKAIELCSTFHIYPDEEMNSYILIEQKVIHLRIQGGFLLDVDVEEMMIKSGLKLDENVEFKVESPGEKQKTDQNIYEVQNENTGWITIWWKDQVNESKKEIKLKPKTKKQFQEFIVLLRKKKLTQHIDELTNVFKRVKKIAKGKTGVVIEVIRLADSQNFAVKGIPKTKFSFQEVQILNKLSHKNIVKIDSIYSTKNSNYIVMKRYVRNLVDWIGCHHIPIRLLHFIKCLLSSVEYIHKNGIMHRDIKPENIMLKKIGNLIEPVLIDFDLAEYIGKTPYKNPYCGTPGYIAPEIVENCKRSKEHQKLLKQENKKNLENLQDKGEFQKYNERCDIFSLGATLYNLFLEKPLFKGATASQTVMLNADCQINFQNEKFLALNQNIQELLRGLLRKDPEERITIEQALKLPLFTEINEKNLQQIDFSVTQFEQLAS